MKFSLVIPVAPYRDAEILKSINELDFPRKDYEIILEKGLNTSKNRNEGFKKSKGKIIVFLDDDAVVDKNLLKNAEKFFKKYSEIDIVGGPQLTPLDEKGFAKVSGYALSSKFGGWNTSNRYGKKESSLNADETVLTSALLFCKKEVMKKIKFDESLWPGEDPKFIADCKRAGFKVAYNPDLIIYHRRRTTMKGLAKQIFNYGKVGPFREKFSETIKKPFFLIPCFFVLYLFFFCIIFLIGLSNSVLVLPLFVYLIMDIDFSIYEGIKNRNASSILLLMIIFPLIHLSYGIGRIFGYFKKFLIKN